TGNTSHFRGPPCTSQESMRLFLEMSLLISGKQARTPDNAGISVTIAAHLTIGAKDQRGTRRVAYGWLPCIVPSDQWTAAGTLTAGVARTHPTRDDPFIALPHTSITGDRPVPCSWWHWWANRELLFLGLSLFFPLLPLGKMREK